METIFLITGYKNLRGGKKKRVILARSVNNNTDDPLSAVVVHVGKYIFKNAFSKDGILLHTVRKRILSIS